MRIESDAREYFTYMRIPKLSEVCPRAGQWPGREIACHQVMYEIVKFVGVKTCESSKETDDLVRRAVRRDAGTY